MQQWCVRVAHRNLKPNNKSRSTRRDGPPSQPQRQRPHPILQKEKKKKKCRLPLRRSRRLSSTPVVSNNIVYGTDGGRRVPCAFPRREHEQPGSVRGPHRAPPTGGHGRAAGVSEQGAAVRDVVSGQAGGGRHAGSSRVRQVRQRVRGVLPKGARAAQAQADEEAVMRKRGNGRTRTRTRTVVHTSTHRHKHTDELRRFSVSHDIYYHEYLLYKTSSSKIDGVAPGTQTKRSRFVQRGRL